MVLVGGNRYDGSRVGTVTNIDPFSGVVQAPIAVARGGAYTFQRYGRSYAVASPQQRAQRAADSYTGKGAYTARRRLWRRRPSRMYGRGMYTGKGGFWGDLWNNRQAIWDASAGLRGLAGNAARASTNPYINAAGQISGMIGTGAYTSNALVNGGQGAAEGVPEFSQGGTGVTISHREYIGDVYGTAAGQTFQNSLYHLNPGMGTTFPWLAQIAQNYDEYTFNQLIFTFRSSIAPIGASASGQVGTIIMATQYNAGEQGFVDKETMMQYDGSMSAKVIDGLLSGVECDPSKMSGSIGKYTRAGPPPAGEDIKTYDLGNFNLAVTNIPAAYDNQSLGELWVSYTVELRKPKFFAGAGLGIARDVFVLPYSGNGYQSASPWAPFNGPYANIVTGSKVLTLGPPNPALLSGQQNNIGCVPFSYTLNGANPGGSLQQGILFPASYAGSLKISVVLTSLVGGVTVQPSTITTVGNVQLIADILSGTWTSAQVTCAPVLSPLTAGTYNTAKQVSGTYRTEIHVRLAIASQGIENYITFSLDSGGPYSVWSQGTIEIEEYNTGFNYKNNGTNDQIMLVNAAGQLVTP